ncbi:MAG: Holliday junction resolvase, partial [Candidatus Parcubacteria bacterium]
MRYLALDIGLRRTGVAYGDDNRIALPLDTLEHDSMQELHEH